MRILGIDYGASKVGLAITDALRNHSTRFGDNYVSGK